MIKCPNCNNTSIQLHTPLRRIEHGVMEKWRCQCGCIITKFYTEIVIYAHNNDGTLIHQEFVKGVK